MRNSDSWRAADHASSSPAPVATDGGADFQAARTVALPATPPPTGIVPLAPPGFGPTPMAGGASIAPTPTAAAPLLGRAIGNWKLVRHLGEGSFGAVYEAHNSSIVGRQAAVKVLHAHMSLQPEIKRRFVNEASAASRAEHENIVQVFDGGITDDGICYVVMELLRGTPLRPLIDRGRLDPARAINVARQVAQALDAAHREGIVHRDLKPDNIFLVPRVTNPEFVKVLDFGIAKLHGDHGDGPKTKTGMWLGTPSYMSPEQWQTLADIDGRSDIYSLGVILFEMTTGRQPFPGNTQFQVMMGHLNEEVVDPSSLAPMSTELAQLIVRMMAKKREDRPATMKEVAAELSTVEPSALAPVDATLVGARTSIGVVEAPRSSSRPPLGPPAGVPSPRRSTGAYQVSSPPPADERRVPSGTYVAVAVDPRARSAVPRVTDDRTVGTIFQAPTNATLLNHTPAAVPAVAAPRPTPRPLSSSEAQRTLVAAAQAVAAASADPRSFADEIRAHLAKDPFKFDHYRVLRKHWLDRGENDKAWCAASALVALCGAYSDETAFYDKLRPKKLVSVRERLTDADWRNLLAHPDEDPHVGAIFAAIWQAGAFFRAGTHGQFGLRRKDRVDLATHPAPFAKVLVYVAQVLNAVVPEVFVAQSGGMRIANCKEEHFLIPSLIIGPDLLQSRPVEELAFRAGKSLAMFRPERYLKLVLSSSAELRIMFMAGMKLAMPQVPVPSAEAPHVKQYAEHLAQIMDEPMLAALQQAAQRFPRTGVDVHLSRWSLGADRTAYRAGFALANDLPFAVRSIKSEPVVAGSLPAAEKVKELVLYAVSEPYFALRRRLGIQL